MKKLLFVANVDWFFISHRLCIAEAAAKEGWEVYVACTDTGRSGEITEKGIHFINLPLSRSGTNLKEEWSSLRHIFQLYRKIKPDVVHHITLKPVIYGSVVAKLTGIEGVVNAISGLGYNFTGRKSLISKIMTAMMKYAFNRKQLTIIFQNNDDEQELRNLGVINEKNKIVKIKGAGVDLEKFCNSPFPEFDLIKILFPTRMLWDKGVRELRNATEILKKKYKGKIKFILVGLADKDNKAGVPAEYLSEWSDGEYVEWVGYQKDMVGFYQNSHIVVLPSYREGMPKSLLEACAVGRAIVTTDAVGCRECVEEGVNGYKVPVHSSEKLAEAIEILANDKDLIVKMGQNSRKKAENEFDVKNVIAKHLEIYSDLL